MRLRSFPLASLRPTMLFLESIFSGHKPPNFFGEIPNINLHRLCYISCIWMEPQHHSAPTSSKFQIWSPEATINNHCPPGLVIYVNTGSRPSPQQTTTPPNAVSMSSPPTIKSLLVPELGSSHALDIAHQIFQRTITDLEFLVKINKELIFRF